MSTAWYRKCVPQMVRSWQNRNSNLTVEAWDTTCVVTNMPPHFKILLNPANPNLSGVSQFVYFPVGGPQPPDNFSINKDTHPIMGYVSQWGGMEVGDGMMFAANVVDGLVHQLGGKELKKACQEALQSHPNGKLSESEAILTPAVGNLKTETHYQHIIHAVPPFFKHKNNTNIPDNVTTEEVLAKAYHSALQVAADVGQTTKASSNTSDTLDDDRIRIATPLLGAGCRGFPVDIAMQVAAEALLGEIHDDRPTVDIPMTLAFAIPSGELRQQLIDTFDRQQKGATAQ